jgi:hypothetical protein
MYSSTIIIVTRTTYSNMCCLQDTGTAPRVSTRGVTIANSPTKAAAAAVKCSWKCVAKPGASLFLCTVNLKCSEMEDKKKMACGSCSEFAVGGKEAFDKMKAVNSAASLCHHCASKCAVSLFRTLRLLLFSGSAGA